MPAACRQRGKPVTTTKLVFTAAQISASRASTLAAKSNRLRVVTGPVLRVQGCNFVLVHSPGGPPSRALAGGLTMVHGHTPCSLQYRHCILLPREASVKRVEASLPIYTCKLQKRISNCGRTSMCATARSEHLHVSLDMLP